jgi:hypothetical protein
MSSIMRRRSGVMHPGSKANGQRAAHKRWPWLALVLEGPEHGRTIPLPVIGVWSPEIDLI